MKKRWRYILAAGVLAALLGVGNWWWRNHVPPGRPPELHGTVEKIREAGPYSPPEFLIRCGPPSPAVPESPQNAWQRQYLPHLWVWVRAGTPVRRRGGGSGQLAVGQTVSAWCSGPMMDSMPPQWPADFVVIESDAP